LKVEYVSPIGKINIESYNGLIAEVSFINGVKPPPLVKGLTKLNPLASYNAQFKEVYNDENVIKECINQLEAYLSGKLKEFKIPLYVSNTPFCEGVWKELLKIPYGETITYKELAKRIGNTAAIRAVGGANHHNPINIIIPCHRVIGANGKLTGFAGGLDKKEFLLKLERGE